MTDSKALTEAQAYEAAYRFVWQYMEREPDPDRVSLLEMLVAMEPMSDALQAADPASFEDWRACVEATRQGKAVPRFPPD